MTSVQSGANSVHATTADRTNPARPAISRSSILSLAGDSWHIIAVIAAFIVSMFIVPVMINVPVGDDWVYTRSVEILMKEGRVEILDLSVVTLVFQVFWGAFFSLLFGTSFGAMRLSTTVLFLLSGVAMYGICLELGIRKARAALGAALYLFNPLAYVLAFTFMTDPQFTSLMVIAIYFYMRGLRIDDPSPRHVIIASAFAACAFLVRQQGLLIPFAVGLYLFTARRWKFNAEGIRTALQVAGIPAIATVIYYAWIFLSHGTPEQQSAFVETIRKTGWPNTRLLLYRMTYIELVYIGFFLLPVIVAVGWHFIAQADDPGDRRMRLFHWAVLTIVIMAGGLVAFESANKLMPFISQYLGTHGLGPQDLIGSRDQLISVGGRRFITWLSFAGAALFVMLLIRGFRTPPSPDRAAASLLASLGFWQIIGVLPPSFHFATWIISVDRYLLPLLPISIALGIWACRNYRLSLPTAWIVTAIFVFYSVAGTRDFLVFQDATWDMGREAIALGIPYDRLDAGAGWDGYYLHQQSLDLALDKKRSPDGSPWWTDLFARATDSSYIVSSELPWGWGEDTIIARREYSSWLHDDPQYLYLLRRPGVQGPP